MKKKLGFLVLGIVMAATPLQAKTNVMVTVDNRIMTFPDAQPFMDSNNRTLVPIRFISEELGAKVNWDEKTKTVSIEQDEKNIEMKLGSSQIKLDGQTKQMDTAPISKQNRTFVPLRFVSEGLGVNVDWLKEVSTVQISTGKEIEVTHIDDLKAEPISKYGNAFVRDGYSEVVIAKASQLPIDNGKYTIYDISISDDKKQIYVTQTPKKETWTYTNVYFSDSTGCKRARNPMKFTKKNSVVTSEYDVIGLSDYIFEGDNFEKYSLDKINYFVFQGEDKLLAIPKSEVLKK